jgi:hypothetical protein
MQAQPSGEQVAEVVQTPGSSFPDGIVDLENTVCPVMGNPAQESIYVDWEGYRVHFCCAGCDNAFLSDPDTFLDILAEDPDVAEKLGLGTESE